MRDARQTKQLKKTRACELKVLILHVVVLRLDTAVVVSSVVVISRLIYRLWHTEVRQVNPTDTGGPKVLYFNQCPVRHSNRPAIGLTVLDKKLSYRRGTARCVVSVEILPIATQQCRNYLYDKS